MTTLLFVIRIKLTEFNPHWPLFLGLHLKITLNNLHLLHVYCLRWGAVVCCLRWGAVVCCLRWGAVVCCLRWGAVVCCLRWGAVVWR